jgi:ATP-dependent DNA helicase RecG
MIGMQPDLAVELGTKETATLEFKSNARDRDRIGKAICALANDLPNKGGGDLLVGVNDDGTPTGTVDDSDRELLKLTEFRDGGEILDRPSLVVDRALYSGEQIVRIQVKAAVAPPVRFCGVAYVRPGPTTRKAHPDDERLLAERRRANDLPFEMRPNYFTTRVDLDMNLFAGTYLPAAIAPEVIAENGRPVDQQLASLHLTDAEGTPTVLGLLVIGYEPRTAIPGGYVQFVRYAGTGRAAAIANDHEIGGNVIAVETQLDPVLRGNLRTGIAPQGILREVPRPEYPWSAIREAVMNAIMHRDYEISNAPIRIDWFDDRIEVSNPGGPYGRVRKDNFDHVNDYRNPSLAAAMKTLGYVNRFGRGITRIKEAMEQNGNPPPEFAVDDAYWSVALRGLS